MDDAQQPTTKNANSQANSLAEPQSEPLSEVIVGIDLGTTNSLVAIFAEGMPRILPDAQGRMLLPSVVRYETGGTIVGEDAKVRAPEFPATTISSVKRLMGRSVADAANDLAFLTYRVEAGERDTARVVIPASGASAERVVSPEEVSAEVLRALKAQAERALGRSVRKAVITVPAYFDDAQRQATRIAGRLAGLDVVRIVPEPTAAALAYGIGLRAAANGTARGAESNKNAERVVAVFDLGGGTFDVSILRIISNDLPDMGVEDGNQTRAGGAVYQVLSTSGDTRLGGDDFDYALVATMKREIVAMLAGDDVGASTPNSTDGAAAEELLPIEARRSLLALAEQIKITLSELDRAEVAIELGTRVGNGEQVGEPMVYRRVFLRDEFEGMIASYVDRTIACCEAAMRDARLALTRADGSVHGLDAVVMVGGSTRIPLVRARVAAHFGIEPYTALDPDTVVALGAAIQAGVLSGSAKGTLLLDVIPLSLGIETMGGAVAKLVLRNSPVPARATEMFSTSVDGQTSIRLTVYQGEREMAEDCRKLGEFRLRGISPMPAGIPQVEVVFLVDANGVLTASALERRSGKRARLQVVPNHGLSIEDVERIERDSLTHAREDMNRHRVVDLIANATLDMKWISEGIARVEKAGTRLESEYKAELDEHLARVKNFVDRARVDWRSVDASAFHSAKDALDRASMRLQEIAIAASLRGEVPKA